MNGLCDLAPGLLACIRVDAGGGVLPRSRTPEEALDSSMLFFGGEEEYARDRYWSGFY